MFMSLDVHVCPYKTAHGAILWSSIVIAPPNRAQYFLFQNNDRDSIIMNPLAKRQYHYEPMKDSS